MKAKDLIDVGSITKDLLNPGLRRFFDGNGGGTTLNEVSNEPDNLPIYICRVVSTANILLNGSVTAVDSVTLAEGDTVLVSGQTNEIENGIYFAFSTGWVRYTDIKPAMLITISEGTVNADTVWMLTSNNFVIGTDDIIFEKVLPVVALPAGTINQTLRHDGTDWVANSLFLAKTTGELIAASTSANALGTKYQFRYTAGTTYQDFGIKADTNEFIQGYIQEKYARFWLHTDKADIQILNDVKDDTVRCILINNSINGTFYVYQNGKIMSDYLTANTYLGANANKEIVSISSPNTIKTTTTDQTVVTGTASWVDIPLLTVMLEPSVTYELQIMLAIEGAQGRAFKLRLNTAAATYVYRPFVKNTSGVGTDVVYAVDGSSAIPQILDNETEINLTTGNTYHYVELKGILTTTNNIPSAKLQIYNDSLFDITVKAYSYMKLTR